MMEQNKNMDGKLWVPVKCKIEEKAICALWNTTTKNAATTTKVSFKVPHITSGCGGGSEYAGSVKVQSTSIVLSWGT